MILTIGLILRARSRFLEIPLIDFRADAERAGWEINAPDNIGVLDLLKGLRQAASKGRFDLWGRPIRGNVELLNRGEILQLIPSSHWLDYEIDPQGFINATDNFFVSTQNLFQEPKPRSRGAYCDLQADRRSLRRWLSSEGSRLLAESIARWRRIPIIEASKRLYEQTKGARLANIVDLQKTEEDKILWLCNTLEYRIPVWGCTHTLSRVPQKIPGIGKRYHFQYINNDVIVRDSDLSIAFENITVLDLDLRNAIEIIRKGDRDVGEQVDFSR
jgi:hypothetical protein